MGLAAVASVWALWHSAWRNMGVRTAFLRASEISLNALVLFSKIAHIPMSKEFTSTFECATDGENYMRVRFCSRRQTLKPTNSRAIASPPEADRSYLLSSPDITCYSSACAHETAMVASALRNNQRAVAIAGCFLYVAGIPVLLLLASWRFAGRRTEDVVSRRMGALFSTYRDGCWRNDGVPLGYAWTPTADISPLPLNLISFRYFEARVQDDRQPIHAGLLPLGERGLHQQNYDEGGYRRSCECNKHWRRLNNEVFDERWAARRSSPSEPSVSRHFAICFARC
ncbi:hypothetical protein BDK51DRAFT_33078 [Blyttiomyces helicus]|uniref:Uncharacterized protein n=1 Tax=Blyttiomyces helicus TaxID=388810 RepID=A0A4V1IRG6_9FUNG|nr:hypothetical protein BDK51DRAFT_33078 [Blyttiomyces helicus]|eukprot:RKO89987.1 hypothetical protein BDK51DRAFT_33078 [Blyttiomyces helicus]